MKNLKSKIIFYIVLFCYCSSPQTLKVEQLKREYKYPITREDWAKHVEIRKDEISNHFLPLLKRFYLSDSENYWVNENDVDIRLKKLWIEYFHQDFEITRVAIDKSIFIIPESSEFQFESLSSITHSVPYTKNWYHYMVFSFPIIAEMDLYGNELKLHQVSGVNTDIYFTILDDYSIKIIKWPGMMAMTQKAYIKRLENYKIDKSKINFLKKRWRIS